MSLRLTPIAEECLQCMHLNAVDQEVIRDCVVKYTEPKPEEISGQQFLSRLSFQVCEVVKWFFSVVTWRNLTVWQIARSTIENRALELASECGTPQEVKKLFEISPVILDNFINHLLRSCIGYNQFSTGAMAPSRKQSCDLQLHVQHVMSTLRTTSRMFQE